MRKLSRGDMDAMMDAMPAGFDQIGGVRPPGARRKRKSRKSRRKKR
jgi:hypothetical protein